MVAEHTIVVGVDGSPPSLEAVDWAAAEAVRRGRPMHILNAFQWPPPIYAPVVAPSPSPFELGIQEAAAQIVAEAADRARAAASAVRLTTATRPEPASVALLDTARTAAEVVVGSRGHGGFAGLLLGSVSTQVAMHAPCPVVVVRHLDRPPGPEAGRVVVGVDGSHDAGDALRFAFEHAASCGAGLTAVLAHRRAGSAGRPDDPLIVDADDVGEDVHRTLAESTAGWREKYPDVDFRTITVRGRASAVLVDRSAGARLLVVGSRGRGGFTGLLLGSVSLTAVQHAACPVAVVRQEKPGPS
ncbi:universal stress protein [Dactylosporangium sp. CA-152071]|uniref:universal stress protein n=1 Tax=Dactylosporangium sp. CA-152071 TaxID=3239933 RepID=UPI003D8D5CD2